MNLLFDDNISYRIVKKLFNAFPNCLHVSRAGLAVHAPDRAIWEYARQNNYLIVTFDEDFEDLSGLYGFPPKVIILRIGSATTPMISQALQAKKVEIEAFYSSDIYGLLEIF